MVLLGWIEEEVPLNSFPTNSEPKPDRIFCGEFCCCRLAKWSNYL